MATDILVTEDSGSVVTNDTTRWPAYTTKADILRDLLAAGSGGRVAIMDIAMKLSNTDNTGLTDKASRIN